MAVFVLAGSLVARSGNTAGAGSLDTGFGGDGMAAAFGVGSGARGVAVQADGKIVVAGSSHNGSDSDIAAARFTPTGSLDRTFSSDGMVRTDIGSGSDDYGMGLAVQADGKIVVAGRSGTDLVVVRYDADGTLDAGFGSGGVVTTDIASGSHDYGEAVALQSDGKIVVVGYGWIGADADVIVVRYNTNGTLDAGFHSDGIVTTDIGDGQGNDRAHDVVVQSDGKIVITGSTNATDQPTHNDNVLLVRYTAAGALDTGFESNEQLLGGEESTPCEEGKLGHAGKGVVITCFGAGSNDFGRAVALQEDGRLVVAGWSGNDVIMVGHLPDGDRDREFQDDADRNLIGKVQLSVESTSDEQGRAVVLQKDRKTVVAGKVDDQLLVLRWKGGIDREFGHRGFVTVGMDGGAEGHAVALQDDGKIVVAGTGNGRFLVVRFHGKAVGDPNPPGGGGGGGTSGGSGGGTSGGSGGGASGGSGGGFGGGGGTGGDEPSNRAPTVAEEIADAALGAGAALEIELSDVFDDPDGDALEYRAESSDETVAAVAVDGDALTVRGLARGTAQVTVTATDPGGETASWTFTVTVTAPEAVWYLPPAADAARQGFVRVLNHSDAAGEVTVTATDDAGRTYAPLTLALGLRGVAAFNADDLENGKADKGLTGATGVGEGGWRLRFDSDALDVEALAYIRTADGFVTGMNATAPRGADGALEIATFNPAGNVDQVSLLRLVNPGTEAAGATVTGVDDAGASPGRPVRLTLPAGSACTVDAAQLESGAGLACGSPQAGLGDGAGKWRLTVASDEPLVAMSLLSSPAGHLTNLSAKARADAGDLWHVDLFPAASDALGRQGFVRVANRASVGGAATIEVNDDGDTRYETLSLELEAGETVHINSDDLEMGNRSKGLTGSTGAGLGTWRLRLHSGVDIEANAYVRTPDGFLTAMQARAPRAGSAHRVAFLNPGSNERQVGVLRLVNRSSGAAAVSIDGTDDHGLRPGTTVRVAVPAADAVELTAAALESGAHAAIESGALGDGAGKWRLRVDGPVTVLSLLSSPGGRLTNLSHADGARGLGELPAALLPAPETVTLTSPADRQLRGRWSAVEGARYDVDLLRDGVPGEHSSLTRARSTSFRWTDRLPGTYMIRVCSVNEDRLRGPCRESEEVEID